MGNLDYLYLTMLCIVIIFIMYNNLDYSYLTMLCIVIIFINLIIRIYQRQRLVFLTTIDDHSYSVVHVTLVLSLSYTLLIRIKMLHTETLTKSSITLYICHVLSMHVLIYTFNYEGKCFYRYGNHIINCFIYNCILLFHQNYCITGSNINFN